MSLGDQARPIGLVPYSEGMCLRRKYSCNYRGDLDLYTTIYIRFTSF